MILKEGFNTPSHEHPHAGCASHPTRFGWQIFLAIAGSALWAGASAEPVYPQALSRYLNSVEPDAVITVFPNQRANYRIPRTIYGTFLEHIGDSVFGGVSAQLLDNPSLEPYPASLANIEKRFSARVFHDSTSFGLPLPWLPLRRSGRRYELRSGNAANSSSYLYLIGLPGREVGIRQPVYPPIERELDYRGVLFASDADPAISLSVSIRRHDHPDEVLARSRLHVPARNNWIKLPFDLKLPAGAVAPLESADFAVALEDGGRFSIDEIRLYPADALNGLDPEIVSWARDLHSPLLRYGGNFSSGYHWRDGVGPVDSRPTRLNQAWGIPEYNEFGTGELMEFCRLIGARPQICLNMGSGSAEEARQWVEYCQGPVSSIGGRRRAANGHSQPYPVAAWEFGNELYDDTQLGWYTPEQYAAKYLDFFRVIEPLVPHETYLLATGGELPSFEKWNGALLRQAAPQLRYVTTHIVADLEDMLERKPDRDTVVAAGLAVPFGVGQRLARIHAQIDANPATRNRVKVAYSEWLFRSPAGTSLPNFDNMGGAVIAAAWLNQLALNADWIPIANMTGLLEFAGIHKARGRSYVTPQYWVLNLYSKHAGDTVIGTETRATQYNVHGGQPFAPEIEGVPYLDVLGTEDSSRGDVALFVVNRNPRASQPATIQVRGSTPARDVKVWTLAASSLLDKNDEEHQHAVRPVESHAVIEGPAFHHVFPAASVTVFLFATR